MTNLKRQQLLDEEKWLLSEILGYDLAGGMYWCEYCKYSKVSDNKAGGECTYKPVKKCPYPCAKAYNSMVK